MVALVATSFSWTAQGHEYTFDLHDLDLGNVSLYTECELPQGGINIFVHTDGDRHPWLYAWDGGKKLLGEFPGKELGDSDFKYVNVKGNDGTKKSYYMYHFDKNEYATSGALGIVIYDGEGRSQSKDLLFSEEGNYFFEYTGYGNLTDETETYVTGGVSAVPEGGTTIFVRVNLGQWDKFNDDAETWIYTWNGDTKYAGEWPGAKMENVVAIDNAKWYYWHTDATGINAIFSENGNNQTQSKNIENIPAGNNFYHYKPFQTGQWDNRYEKQNDFTSNIPLKNRTANFDVWNYNKPSSEIVMTSPDGNFRLTFTLGYENVYANPLKQITVADVWFDKETGRLQLPARSTIKVESLSGYYLNKVVLGPMTAGKEWGVDATQFSNPAEENGIHDWVQTTQRTNSENYWLSNFFRDVLFGKTEMTFGGQSGSDLQNNARYIGPTIVVRDECTTAEELTFADHDVKQSKHFISDDLVGVDVYGDYLICRSLNPISAAHKHQPNASQKILKVNGVTPAYADPATVQYSWIALKIDNAKSLIGAQLSKVRGGYCMDSSDKNSHAGWKNPTMTVESYDVVKPAGSVETTLNTYCVANFSEQDKTNQNGYTPKYFYMEPRHWEICNVVDVMRTPNEVVLAPTENALLPAGVSNYYYRMGVEGSAALKDFVEAWEDVDKETGAAYLTYNHVFDINHAIAYTIDWNQTRDTDYDYPLDTPNSYYDNEANSNDYFFLWGMTNTTVRHADGYTDDNFATAELVYYSRYDVENNNNSYKNDLRVMVNNPKTDLSSVHDLKITRRDRLGNNPVEVATLQRVKEGEYKVVYNAESQVGTDKVNNLGDQHYKNVETTYTLNSQAGNNIIYLSDRFLSVNLTNEESINAENDYYQYRVEPGEGTPSTVTCVVNGVPVFKSSNYELTRATFTKEEVDNDTDGELTEAAEVDIEFDAQRPTSNYSADTYNVWKGSDRNKMTSSDIEGSLEMENFLTKTIDANDTYNSGVNFYVPVQWTEYNDNTYGTYKQEISDAKIELETAVELMASVKDNDGKRYCHAEVNVKSDIFNTPADKRYMIRLWRKQGDKKVLLNNATELKGGNAVGDGYNWQTNYYELSQMDADTKVITLKINDTFLATEVKSPKAATGTVDMEDITYLATLYVLDEASQKYYVKTTELKMETKNVPTAITTVAGNAAIQSVTYYSVSGVASATPHSGMNIVVTRYSDGTTTTAKVVK